MNTSNEGLSAGVSAFTERQGAAVVIDATGVPELIRSAVEFVAHSGTVVIVDISELNVEIPVIEFTRKELDLRGSRNSRNLFSEAIELIHEHQREVRSWVTHRVEFEQVPSIIERATRHPEDVEKVLVKIGARPHS